MNIKFNVSAKTARLIGRENIADVDGAVIELIKNGYDADASCCLIKFNMPFPNINMPYSKMLLKSLLKSEEYDKLLEYCIEKDNIITKKDDLTLEQESALEKILFAHNMIVIADNGQGMTKSILETAWMNIGTNNKEKNYSSEKGRVKTGAKGIGRFALDKLSTESLVYSKNKEDALYRWHLNWNDFDKVELLDEVSADLNIENTASYQGIVEGIFSEYKEQLSAYSWESGTVIILSPLREQWNERLFNKIIKSLNSLNPLNSVDQFDVHLFNPYFDKYSISQKSSAIKREEYDYKLQLEYDGKDSIDIKLDRNEIDITLNQIEVIDKETDKIYKFNLDDFWNREKFKLANYTRDDYNKEISFNYRVGDFYENPDDVINFSKIGKFKFEMLFLKGDNSTLEIVKNIPVKSRRKLMELHSGLKIYRDNFKVRPYGDDGPLYDWLNLGKRAQLSPAAVTHEKGYWRVLPYQVIGNLRISRIENTRLEDMANREAIALNDTYYLMVDFLQNVIKKFEYDRQYVLREFALWRKGEIEKLQPEKTRIISQIKKKRKNKGNQENDEEYSKEQYENVINDLATEKDGDINAQELLMMFSASGIMANTFSHELQRISTDLGTRIQHLRSSILRIIQPNTYSGDPDFNPFPMLEECQKTDELLSSWIRVIMDGIQGESLERNDINLVSVIDDIIEKWKPLLQTKRINIIFDANVEKIKYNITIADVYLILNNFILNSAWFLEKVQDREISIELNVDEKFICLILKNNGEKLDGKYRDNPFKIFEIGETSKFRQNEKGDNEKIGTGIGLWIVDQCTKKYYAQIEILNGFDGFGFSIKFQRS